MLYHQDNLHIAHKMYSCVSEDSHKFIKAFLNNYGRKVLNVERIQHDVIFNFPNHFFMHESKSNRFFVNQIKHNRYRMN